MKEYKIGDTIYVKDTIVAINIDDTISAYRGGYNGWLSNRTIVDELPTAEPVKPVLPKDVADEMEEYKTTGFDLIDYFSAINECADDVKNSSKYVYDNTDEINDQRVTNLANAWYNGYTVEKERKYNLILGTDTDGDTNALVKNNPRTDAVMWIDTDTYADDLKLDKFYQFTQDEIDKYNQDFWIKGIDLNDYKVEVKD